MSELDDYELLDFGDGRRLERFGNYIIDRPCPTATCEPHDTALWQSADTSYKLGQRESGAWKPPRKLPACWNVSFKPLTLELRLTERGQLGVFPEQKWNWGWIGRQVARAGGGMNVLNLFAHTGASTLAAAAAGARVTHVDSSRSSVSWARRNAKHSGLEGAPIRWIVDDVTKFVCRELRRQNHYDAVILDPPSFGRGPDGETWKLTDQLIGLLDRCAELTASRAAFYLLTCHTSGIGPAEISAYLSSLLGSCQAGVAAEGLRLTSRDGRRLSCGVAARWGSRES